MTLSKMKLPMTEAEKERKALHDNVVAMYRGLKTKFPDASDNRLMVTISKEKGLTVPGVRMILIRHGVYTPRTSH